MERPKPRSEPSTARRERSLSPSFMGVLAYCNLQITYYKSLFCQAKSYSSIHFPILLNLHGLFSLERNLKAANSSASQTNFIPPSAATADQFPVAGIS